MLEAPRDATVVELELDPPAAGERLVHLQNRRPPAIVSLFSGAGGMDLGFKQAGFPIAVAFDISEAAVATHRRNFRRTKAVQADLVNLKPAGVLAHVRTRLPEGSRIGVIGGPPCQGFSRANTNAQADDPRNGLPSLYLRVVRALMEHYVVEFVVLENVLGMRDKRHRGTYLKIVRSLVDLGFDVTEKELCALDYGVAQTRQRILLSALRNGQGYLPVRPRRRKGLATVRQTIGHIRKEPVHFRRKLDPRKFPLHPNHWTMKPKSARFEDRDFADGGRSFKRLRWDQASPTIAFGNREIHVHPRGHRRLSIYEALLLQGFPSTFVLSGNLSEQVEQVSNAVPPPLARSVARAVRLALRAP